jgi:hypothetical protein
MKSFLAALFRPTRKHDTCAELMPLDDAWLRRAAARSALVSVHSHA